MSGASNAGSPGLSGLRSVGALMVLCGAIFLEGIDVAMLNVALPAIRAELGLDTTTLSAVVSLYVLGYAGFMLLGGRAADLLGKRRVFMGALAVFILFSGLGGFATEGWMLLVARFVTGVASAFMTPAGLALITANFAQGPARNQAILIYSGTGAAGFSLGLVAGGLLAAVDWRLVFFTPVILAGIIFALTPILIAEDGRRDRNGSFDLPGAVLLTSAMLLAAFAVTRLEKPFHAPALTVGAVVSSMALAAAFTVIETRRPDPLVRLGILRSSQLVRANLGALLFAAAFFAFQFLVSIYLQELLGWTPLETSLALLAVAVDAIVAPTVTPRLVARFGTPKVVVAGLALSATSYALFLRLDLGWTYAAMFPSMILIGLSFAFVYGPLTILATDAIAEAEQGLASALVNTSFQFGAGIGLSAASAISVLALGANPSPDMRLEAIRLALLVPVAAVGLGILVAVGGVRRDTSRGAID